MKRKIWVTAGIAAALAFLIAFGAVGCVVSGFDLPLDSYAKVVLICGAASVFCAAAFSLKWGGAAVLCALALGAGYVWKQDEAAEQLFGLLYRMTSVYGNAYGWDPVQLADGAAAVDIPMAVLGVLLSAAVTWSVCRKLGAVLPVAASLIPLSACMVVTDTVPDVQYLFCLLFGLIILILTGRVRRQSAPQGNRLTAMAAIPAALALAALFLTFPQESYVNRSEATRDAILSWFQSIPEKVAENVRQEVTVSVPAQEPDHVRLASLGRRTESPITVMEVTAEIGGTLYLRGQDYDGYDGMTWTVSQHRTEDFSLTGEDYGEVSIRTVGERALLYLPYYPARSMALIGGNMSNTWAYTEYVIPRAGLPDDWRARAISGSATPPDLNSPYLALPDATRARAEVLLADILGGASATPPDLNSPYLALPDATRARAEVLLADILGGASSTVEKAEKIGDYVRASARYDLNPSRIGEGETDFALWFLEDAEAGYCVHFATAAAVLLRAAGIEARYVSGYLVKTAPGTPADITEKNAHAWAEYYEPTLGVWLVLEATPSDMAAAQQPTPETVPGATQEAAQPTSPEPTTPPPATSPSHPQPPTESAPPQPDAPKQHNVGRILAVLLALGMLVLVVTVQRSIRIRLRRGRQQTARPNARGLAMWQETELLSRLLHQPSPEALETLAQKAKFSQHTLTVEELEQFTAYLTDARHQLEQKPLYLRLVYRYLYAVI